MTGRPAHVIAQAFGFVRLLLCFAERGEEHADQNRNDPDDDKKFDEGKCGFNLLTSVDRLRLRRLKSFVPSK
jgi:hypothetical protein